jgi:hypothetical protein
MDTAGIIRLPIAHDPIEADLREIDAAIEMIVRGAARRVRLAGLTAADEIAAIALARAQAAGVELHVERDRNGTRFTLGPYGAELPRRKR